MRPSTRSQNRALAALTTVFEQDDILWNILFFLNRDSLSASKGVARMWAALARTHCRTAAWQANHLTLQEMITEWRPRAAWPSDAALLLRLRQATGAERDTKTDDGRTLLHCALSRALAPRSNEVVAALIKSNPQDAFTPDDTGRLPLHYAASSLAERDTIEALLRCHPEAADHMDKGGKYPVVGAVRGICSTSVDKLCILLAAMSQEALEDAGRSKILGKLESKHLGEGAKKMLAEYLSLLGLVGFAPEWLRKVVPEGGWHKGESVLR